MHTFTALSTTGLGKAPKGRTAGGLRWEKDNPSSADMVVTGGGDAGCK